LCECALAGGRGRGACVFPWTCGRVGGCAGAFQTAVHQIERNPACGWFNVYKWRGKWIGQVFARGVQLRTTPHAEAWRAAVELEWLLDRWCREHGACLGSGAARMFPPHCACVRRGSTERVSEQPAAAAGGGARGRGGPAGGACGGAAAAQAAGSSLWSACTAGAFATALAIAAYAAPPTRRCVMWARRCR
jgi:hypothetical protein